MNIIKKMIIFFIRNMNRYNLRGSVFKGEFPEVNGLLIVRNNGGRITFGHDVVVNSRFTANPVGNSHQSGFFLKPEADLIIGDNVGMSNVMIYSWSSIVIEDNVLIGGGVQIYDTDFHSLGYTARVLEGDSDVIVEPVKICEGAFIGANSIILKGVTIGAHSIVGAGTVVTKSIPSGQIWAGNPAKFIRSV